MQERGIPLAARRMRLEEGLEEGSEEGLEEGEVDLEVVEGWGTGVFRMPPPHRRRRALGRAGLRSRR